QHDGLLRRRLPLHRFHEDRHSADRAVLPAVDVPDPALLAAAAMTRLPEPAPRKLGLVIDLDTCVGCHACAVACKEWNDGGAFGPLPDADPYGAEPRGVWFNRVHSYAIE